MTTRPHLWLESSALAMAAALSMMGCARDSVRTTIDAPVPDAASPLTADAAARDGQPDLEAAEAQPPATDSADADPNWPFDPRAGQRLQVIWFEAPSGASVVQGWYDTKLQQRCDFLWAMDGKLRCVPVLTFDASQVTCNGATCFTGFAVAEYGKRDDLGTCPPRQRLYRRGAPIAVAGLPEARTVAEVDPAELVSAQVRSVGAERLTALVLEADDGARGLFAWHDSKLELDCEFRDLESEGRSRFSPELHCLPPWHGYRGTTLGPFADAACQVPAAEVSDVCPASFVWGDRGECPGPISLYRLGKPLDRGFGGQPGSCQETSPPGSNRYFEVSEMVSPGELVWAKALLEGSGRIQTIVMSTPAGRTRRALWDRELQAVCRPWPTAQGTICLPQVDHQDLGFRLFADAACAEPLSQESAKCAPPRLIGDAAFPEQIRRVGEPYTGPMFTTSGVDRKCRPADAPAAPMVTYRLGPVLPPSAFVALTEHRR
jgi:hypothetical protein